YKYLYNNRQASGQGETPRPPVNTRAREQARNPCPWLERFLVADDLFGLLVEDVHAVEVDGELNLVPALGLHASRCLDRDLLTLADRVQADLSAHQLGDLDVCLDEVVGCMCENDVFGADVLV